jgi:hypothetical protein
LLTLVNKEQAVLFGGARGTSGNYTICDDAYLFNIKEKMWLKLNRNLFNNPSFW